PGAELLPVDGPVRGGLELEVAHEVVAAEPAAADQQLADLPQVPGLAGAGLPEEEQRGVGAGEVAVDPLADFGSDGAVLGECFGAAGEVAVEGLGADFGAGCGLFGVVAGAPLLGGRHQKGLAFL